MALVRHLVRGFDNLLSLQLTPTPHHLHTSAVLNFRLSLPHNAEPMKKKRRIDPAILKARDERKKRRIEKNIRQLQKNAQKLKPIDEMIISRQLLAQVPERRRQMEPVSEEEVERRVVLGKVWTRYKRYQYLAETDKISTMIVSAESALRELRLESEELFQKAVALENTPLPVTLKGPVYTPPIPDYTPPDGDYIDATKRW